MKINSKMLIGFLFSLVLIFLLLMMGIRIKENEKICHKIILPIKISQADHSTYDLVGWLCAKGSLKGKTVQLLVSGTTYDHNYWDFPYEPKKYSYVREAIKNGYVVFNIDRLGVGLSAHPPANLMTLPNQAYEIHQIVHDLRVGKVGGVVFKKVIGVGHSMGAAIWMIETAEYNDVNGLILADYLHKMNLPFVNSHSDIRWPAQQDPKFYNKHLPEGYLTTRPGIRGQFFYNSFSTDPKVIQLDESLKQTTSIGEMSTVRFGLNPIYTESIKVPVLLVVGQKDFIFCDNSILSLSCMDSQSVLRREKKYYSASNCLRTYVLSNSGHDTNLHLNAALWFSIANKWANQYIGNKSAPYVNGC